MNYTQQEVKNIQQLQKATGLSYPKVIEKVRVHEKSAETKGILTGMNSFSGLTSLAMAKKRE
jgi:hypothetical protein